MLKELDVYNKEHFSKSKDYLRIGIGIDSGMVMLGSVGEKNRMQGTAISHSINVASRVEDLTKLYGASLFITEETYSRLKSPQQYAVRYIDNLLVHAESQSIKIYEIFDTDSSETAALKRQSRADFESAVSFYRDGIYQDALALFDKLVQFNKNDLPALCWREIVSHTLRERASH